MDEPRQSSGPYVVTVQLEAGITQRFDCGVTNAEDTLAMWRAAVDKAARELRGVGLEVRNAIVSVNYLGAEKR